MQETHSLNPPVVSGICDPNKSPVRYYRSLKLGSKLKYLKNERSIDFWINWKRGREKLNNFDFLEKRHQSKNFLIYQKYFSKIKAFFWVVAVALSVLSIFVAIWLLLLISYYLNMVSCNVSNPFLHNFPYIKSKVSSNY